MSRVHDALMRAGQMPDVETAAADAGSPRNGRGAAVGAPLASILNLNGLLDNVQEIPFNPAPESHLIDLHRPMETPSEEFRSLRTKLNYIQTLQPIHTVVITSPSPAEGKSFTTMNLALAESHLADNRVLCADFDLRRPTLHNMLQVERAPGVSDFLMGKATLDQIIRKIAGSNLYFMPAGTIVKNPLELLNLREAKALFDELPQLFNWVLCDSPPVLFSADSTLLSNYADGTVLVVRTGATTIDTITRATQALSESNVLGVVANGARAGELYSKYTYYYSKKEEPGA
ncbi:MAG: CpsD/CapB family tyrosine-protein kinase [Bryobacteraceae bacterium]